MIVSEYGNSYIDEDKERQQQQQNTNDEQGPIYLNQLHEQMQKVLKSIKVTDQQTMSKLYKFAQDCDLEQEDVPDLAEDQEDDELERRSQDLPAYAQNEDKGEKDTIEGEFDQISTKIVDKRMSKTRSRLALVQQMERHKLK